MITHKGKAKAMVKLPTGMIVFGDIKGDINYDHYGVIQLTIEDITYTTHTTNVVIIKE